MFGRTKVDVIPRKARESRAAKRMAVSQDAWIKLGGGFAVRSCKIVDWSQSGVRLRLSTDEALPSTFQVLFSRGAAGRACRLKWRRGKEVGAEYI